MNLEKLARNVLIQNAAKGLSTKHLSATTLLALFPSMGKICNIKEELKYFLCNSDLIRISSTFVTHTIYDSKAKNVTCLSFSKSITSYDGFTIKIEAALKSNDKGSEVVMKVQNGMIPTKHILDFMAESKEFFDINGSFIGVKCALVYSKYINRAVKCNVKVFFHPIRSFGGISTRQVDDYIHSANLDCIDAIVNEDFSMSLHYMFTIENVRPTLLNWETCPCQSYICRGGLDAEFTTDAKVCSLSYSDTHPFFRDQCINFLRTNKE